MKSTTRLGTTAATPAMGRPAKTLKGEFGEMPLETPRDRNGSYEPRIVAKGQTRWAPRVSVTFSFDPTGAHLADKKLSDSRCILSTTGRRN